MKKYEYGDAILDRSELVRGLNSHSYEGWKVISVHYQGSTVHVIFEREIEPKKGAH